MRLTLLGGLSGCQEGWALYAERFMDELGLYQQPGARLGYLFMQLLRAARVVLDIGLHLRLPVPSAGGASWTPDAALQLLRDRCHQGPYASVELARYRGRPGQALAFKVGERGVAGRPLILPRRPAGIPPSGARTWLAGTGPADAGADRMTARHSCMAVKQAGHHAHNCQGPSRYIAMARDNNRA